MAGIKDLKPKKGGQYKQGYYEPIYPQKYKTNSKQIIYRSSWEFKLCKWFDLTPEVIEWASEPVSIKYFYTWTTGCIPIILISTLPTKNLMELY